MKPTVAADEMFPEGVGPWMDLEEVCFVNHICKLLCYTFVVPLCCIVHDKVIFCRKLEVAPLIATLYVHNCFHNISLLQAGGPSNLLMDLAANEKAVHAGFFNGTYFSFW